MRQKQVRLTDVVGLVETPLRLRLTNNRKHFSGTLHEDGTITIWNYDPVYSPFDGGRRLQEHGSSRGNRCSSTNIKRLALMVVR